MKRVLIVDDSDTVRNQVRTALREGGFSVVEASDGEEALALLRSDTNLSLVILDINMPIMNGLELLERLSAEKTVDWPPVLMLTTEAQRTMMDRAKKAGAKGWMIKPVKPDLLLGAVNKLAR